MTWHQASQGGAGEPGSAAAMTTVQFDASVPNAARIYDYLLGGKDNFEADRQAADRLLKIAPDAAQAAADNRKFLRNVVQFLAREAGVTQFLDIGSGLPGLGNVHEVAREQAELARVAYVDYDEVVVSHALNRLVTDPLVIAVKGDLRDPGGITGNMAVRELIDFGRPVAVTLVAVLHFLDDPSAYAAVGYLKDVLAPGSYLAISHATPDRAGEGEAAEVTGVYERASARLYLRTGGQVREFLDGLELVPPGVVEAGNWRSKAPALRVTCYGGVGKKK
jgi:hypothetical protein